MAGTLHDFHSASKRRNSRFGGPACCPGRARVAVVWRSEWAESATILPAADWLPWVRFIGRSNPPAADGRFSERRTVASRRTVAASRTVGRTSHRRIIHLPGSSVPALGFCIVPLAATPVFAPTCPAACTGVMWFRCMACCNRAVCRSNDAGRDAARPLPKKRCAVPCTVPGAAARPLADKLARDGTTADCPSSCVRCAIDRGLLPRLEFDLHRRHLPPRSTARGQHADR